MGLNLHTQQYVEWKVYNVTTIKEKYGFRVKLIFLDGSVAVQQKSGFTSKRAAEAARTEIIGQLSSNTYVVYDKVILSEYMEYWLEEVMRPEMSNDSYVSYKNAIVNHINPQIGNLKLVNLSRAKIQKLYNDEFKISESVTRLIKTVMNTSMAYALDKKMLSVNPASGVSLPKQKKPKKKKEDEEFRVRHIDEQKTLNLKQVLTLINAAKGTPIYLQVMFATLMGLRRSEINGVKYTDIDYINRTLRVERQLGIVPMSEKEDFAPKTYTKQEIDVKTESSHREIPIPDILFEAILEERQKYEKNRRRRINDKTNPFCDMNYVCCSTYGRPRSKDFHWPHFKKLLQENDLPDIRWHDLRSTYGTILLKNDFNPKAISKLMGHATEIITIDVYGDNQEIIEDCLDVLEPFIEKVMPEEESVDLSDVDCIDAVAIELIC